MTVELSAPHEDLTFMTPLSEARADKLVEFLAHDLHGVVLDIGCGCAELLLRVLAAAPDARGMGIDLDERSIAHARHLAETRRLVDRVSLVVGDARTSTGVRPDAVVCIGATQVWGPPVEDKQPLDYGAALAAIRALVPRGAAVLYGEGIWSRPPTAAAVEHLAGRLDELVSVAELIDITVAEGFMSVAVHEASIAEWDEFESGYIARYATWLAEHDADHPDAAEVRAGAARQRAAYFRGYRGTMGMAYLLLRAV